MLSSARFEISEVGYGWPLVGGTVGRTDAISHHSGSIRGANYHTRDTVAPSTPPILFTINETLPPQDVGLVPIVEPDVSMSGTHTLEAAVAINTKIQSVLYRAMLEHGVFMEV